jgi:hypothetical protein
MDDFIRVLSPAARMTARQERLMQNLLENVAASYQQLRNGATNALCSNETKRAPEDAL